MDTEIRRGTPTSRIVQIRCQGGELVSMFFILLKGLWKLPAFNHFTMVKHSSIYMELLFFDSKPNWIKCAMWCLFFSFSTGENKPFACLWWKQANAQERDFLKPLWTSPDSFRKKSRRFGSMENWELRRQRSLLSFRSLKAEEQPLFKGQWLSIPSLGLRCYDISFHWKNLSLKGWSKQVALKPKITGRGWIWR